MECDGLSRLCVRLHDHRGAVGENFRHGPSHLGGVKANGYNGIRSKVLGMFCQSLESLRAHLFEELCVDLDLPASPRSEEGPYVLSKPPWISQSDRTWYQSPLSHAVLTQKA